MNPIFEEISPEGNYVLRLSAVEMRMSHWVERPFLIHRQSGTVVLDLTQSLWHLDSYQWAGNTIHLQLRRYPGDCAPVRLTADLENGRISLLNQLYQPQEVEPALETYYRHNRQ